MNIFKCSILLVKYDNVTYAVVPQSHIITDYPELTTALTKAYQRRGYVPKVGAKLKVSHHSEDAITIQKIGSTQKQILLYV